MVNAIFLKNSLSMTTNKISLKRTSLNSRKIAPKFCVRFMKTSFRTSSYYASYGTRMTMLESNQISRNLLKNSQGFMKTNSHSVGNRRHAATRAEFHAFEETNGYEIRKIVSKDPKINNHYQYKHKETRTIEQLTHAKMTEGKANNENPIVGPGYGFLNTEKSGVISFIQRIVKNPGDYPTREVLDSELKNVKLDEWRFIPDLLKLKRENPKLFNQGQVFLRDFLSYEMKIEETPTKTSLLIHFLEIISRVDALNQEIKDIKGITLSVKDLKKINKEKK